MTALSAALRRISELTGRAISWVTIPLVVLTFVIVVLRYAFDLGWIWMQESIVWMHAGIFMLAAAYTLEHDAHVRVDIFYRTFDARRRAIVDIAGTVFLMLPMLIFLIVSSLDYVATSWSIHEGSREAGGLPYPVVPLMKSVIPLTSLLLIVQGVAQLLGDIGRLTQPAPQSEDSGQEP